MYNESQLGCSDEKIGMGGNLPNGQEPLPNPANLPSMVVWYGPRALYATGLRHLISSIFGQYADQRILQWATDQVPDAELAVRYDYSKMATEDGVAWVDYVADPGDGFDSCYAVASLVAAQSLDVEGAGRLQGGQVLIMGGDQVYPYASIHQYEQHLVQPYRLADCDTSKPDRKLFALPGNHDWYDGLSAFDHIFCRVRDGVSKGLNIGRWHCPQHRSYFAIKLPHDWWIWGLDTQLTRNLDVGQIRYFQAVARSIPEADRSKAKIVLCLPRPIWHDLAEKAENAARSAFPSNLDRLVPFAFDEARVCAVLSGDLHHYSRYHSAETGLNLITSGGGGAYLSPTHHLPNTLQVPWKGEMYEFSLRDNGGSGTGETPQQTAPSLFPSPEASRSLSWRLLLFPFYSWTFSIAALGVIYWFITWRYMESDATGMNYGCDLNNVGILLRNADSCDVSGVLKRIVLMLDAGTQEPLLPFTVFALLAILFLYVRSSSRSVRLIASVTHWAAHIAAMSELATWFTRFNHTATMTAWLERFGSVIPHTTTVKLIFLPEMVVFGGFIGGLIWGIYLFINCRISHLHMDDAFSALRIKGYKQFLRLRVEPDKLTIYPIGLKRVPMRFEWRARTPEERAKGVRAAFVARRGLKPHLIEGPIVIRPADVKDF